MLSDVEIKAVVGSCREVYNCIWIIFSIGGFFGGYLSYVVELSDELKAYTKLWKDEEPL